LLNGRADIEGSKSNALLVQSYSQLSLNQFFFTSRHQIQAENHYLLKKSLNFVDAKRSVMNMKKGNKMG
jgi:hypothetical protein